MLLFFMPAMRYASFDEEDDNTDEDESDELELVESKHCIYTVSCGWDNINNALCETLDNVEYYYEWLGLPASNKPPKLEWMDGMLVNAIAELREIMAKPRQTFAAQVTAVGRLQ